MPRACLRASALAGPSFWQVHLRPEPENGAEQEYAPAELTMRSTLPPASPPDEVSVNDRSSGRLTAYTIFVGERPVVTYVASNVVASPDFSPDVNWSMAARLAATAWLTFLTADTTPQPVRPKPLSRSATATAREPRCRNAVRRPAADPGAPAER